jgi:hypothetical protein
VVLLCTHYGTDEQVLGDFLLYQQLSEYLKVLRWKMLIISISQDLT